MNDQSAITIQSRNAVRRVADCRFGNVFRGMLASLGVTIILVSAPAQAAIAPSLGSTSTYGVVASTFSNSNAAPKTIIKGDVCYTTGPVTPPLSITGTTVTPCPPATGADQTTALAGLNTQSCTPIGAAVSLDSYSVNGGTPGVFPPGCYSSTGAMSITTGAIVHLSGAGVYVFRSGGALNPAANSQVLAEGGACASDVFWAPISATTIGANANIAGNILDAAGITIGHLSNLSGRALVFGGTVTTDANTIAVPACTPFVTPVPPGNGVSLGKVFFPATITAGEVSRLTITLSSDNSGITTLQSPLTDNLPGGMVIASTPNASTSCGVGGVTAVVGSSTVTLATGSTIPGGAGGGGPPGTCAVAVNVTSHTAGSFPNTLGIGALHTDSSNPDNPAPASATLIVLLLSAIPTLSNWAMIMLSALLAIAGFAALRRRLAR